MLAAPPVSVAQASLKDIDSVSADRQAAIRQAVSLGLISGYPNGAFKPEESLTRTQLAVLLAKALHLPIDTNAGSSFKDVASDSWSAGYIDAVRKAGLMNGTDTGFDPNRKVTRQELASVFVRAVNGLNTTGGLETDPALASGASGWAAASVQAALRLGLMTPEDDGFQPQQTVARADIAQFLVDIFAEKEQTATITKVDGDVITVGGTPLLVSDALKRLLLEGGNKEALLGAVLKFKSAVRNVNELKELEIVSAGTKETPVKLDTTGMPAGGTLKVSGDHVAISGGTIKHLTLQNQASSVSVDASVDRLELTGQAVTLSGKGSYREIQITDPKAKLTIGSDVRIDRLVLPDGIALADIVTNLSQVQAQIGSIVSASGAPVTKPSAPVSYNPPTVADKSALDAAIADASGIADAAVAGAAEGQYPQGAIDALKATIEAASAVKADTGATQVAIDSAAATLRTAINVFKNAVVHVGTTLLDDAIADASGYADTAVAGGAEGQYPRGAIDALKEAIEAAEAVKADKRATQTVIDGAAFTLREAIDTFKDAVVHIDLAQLNAAIAAASDLADTAVVGTLEGEYPQSAIDALNEAIEAAEEAKANSGATQAEVDSAEAALQEALATFREAVSHSLKASLLERPFYLNSGKTGTAGDTVLSAESYEQYNKRNIKNYLQIKRGIQNETIEYDSDNPAFNVFNVVEDEGNVVGTVTVESTSEYVVLSEATNGITVHPIDDATESTEAALVFTVKEDGREVSRVTMPIIMDETTPTLLGSEYGNGQFTLTSSEALSASLYSCYVTFSQDGTGSDYVPLESDDFVYDFVDNRIIVTLTDKGKATHILGSSSKFRITGSGFTDYAGNDLLVDSTVAVSEY